jgi:hypothetical protein
VASTGRRIRGRDRLIVAATGSEVSSQSGTAVYVAAPVASKLALITQPAGAVDGAAFTTQPVVELQTAGGTAVLQSGVTVTASIVAGAGTLVGTATAVTAGNGRATFSNLGIDATSPPASFTVRFSATGLTSVDSSSFTVSAGGGALWPLESTSAAWQGSADLDMSQSVPSPPDNVDRPIAGGNGWNMIYFGDSWLPGTTSSFGLPDKPAGFNNRVWRGRYTPGSYGGGVVGAGSGYGIGNFFLVLGHTVRRVHIGMLMYFDFPDASYWHPISNKGVNIEGSNALLLRQWKEGSHYNHCEQLHFTSGALSFFIDNDSPSSDGEKHPAGQLNNNAVPLRQWVKSECEIDLMNGVFRSGQDGVLTTVSTPPFTPTTMQPPGINFFRGGGGETLSQNRDYYVGHIHVRYIQ